jgi:hypothetical protein
MTCTWQPVAGDPVYATCPHCGHTALLHKRVHIPDNPGPPPSTCDLCELHHAAEYAAAEVFRLYKQDHQGADLAEHLNPITAGLQQLATSDLNEPPQPKSLNLRGGPVLDDVDPVLIHRITELAETYGLLGVARVAVKLLDMRGGPDHSAAGPDNDPDFSSRTRRRRLRNVGFRDET